MRYYKVARCFTQNSQSTLSYLLPSGKTSGDILRDLDEKILSPQINMKAKKLMKLLPPKILSRWYYTSKEKKLRKWKELHFFFSQPCVSALFVF